MLPSSVGPFGRIVKDFVKWSHCGKGLNALRYLFHVYAKMETTLTKYWIHNTFYIAILFLCA